MTVLVTGGAGYIGSHIVRLLRLHGHSVVVVDDFSSGVRTRVDVPVVELDLASADAVEQLSQTVRSYDVTRVIHLAALKDVGESMTNPERYYRANTIGLLNLLETLKVTGIRSLVFSSSAAVYGDSEQSPVSETSSQQPANPYGESKLIGEWMIEAAKLAWGLRAVSLRYFNVAGAGWPELGDRTPKNLIPIVLDRVRRGEAPVVFGMDHGTPDGSCIRDYIHVSDLAEAHLRAIDALWNGALTAAALNLGTGVGASVIDVLDTIHRVTGANTTPQILTRRDGDPAALVADASLAAEQLNWKPTKSLEDMVRSAWVASPGPISQW